MASLARILRYPIKALSAEPLDRALLTPGHGLPGDRRFALALAGTDPDAAAGWLPRERLLSLSRFPRLAQLQTMVDGDRVTIRRRGRVVLEADLTTARGQTVVSAFFAAFLAGESFGHPRVVEWREGFRDRPRPWLSLVGAGSLDELERTGGQRLEAEQLRMNLLVDDLPPRIEQGWIGQRLRIGRSILGITETIERAVLPELLRKTFGHGRLGVWAEVEVGGEIHLGDRVTPLGPMERPALPAPGNGDQQPPPPAGA